MKMRNWVPIEVAGRWYAQEASASTNLLRIPCTNEAHATEVCRALRAADNLFQLHDHAWIYRNPPEEVDSPDYSNPIKEKARGTRTSTQALSEYGA